MPRFAVSLAKLEILTQAITIDDWENLNAPRSVQLLYNFRKIWHNNSLEGCLSLTVPSQSALERDLSNIPERGREKKKCQLRTNFSPARSDIFNGSWLPVTKSGPLGLPSLSTPPLCTLPCCSRASASAAAIKCTIHLRINLRRFLQSHKACCRCCCSS